MSSSQVIDTEKRTRSLTRFFHDLKQEKQTNAVNSAQARADEVYKGTDAGFDVTNLGQQMGRPLSRSVITAKLKSLNPSIIIEQSRNYPDRAGVYLRDGVSNMEDLNYLCRGRKFIVGMEWGVSTEFSVTTPRLDAYGTPESASIRKGWRSVLAHLIKARAITVEQAEKAFQVSKGRQSEKWWNQLQ